MVNEQRQERRAPSKWTISTSTLVLICSLSGIPVSRACSLLQDYYDSFVLFAIGTGVLFGLILLVSLRDGIRNTDLIYYVFVLCTFSSVVDFLIGLENDGLISGFVDFYLKNGEPYLRSAYGIHICYWDGTVHYVLYIRMLYALANGEDCRSVAIFWLGSFINSLIVFLPGNFLGRYPIKWSMLLNVPYIIIAIYAAYRFIPRCDDDDSRSGDQQRAQSSAESLGKTKRLHLRRTASEIILDQACVLFLISCVALAFLRALGSLGCPHLPFSWYVAHVEPNLNAVSVAYPRLQVLAYAYYFVPYYCYAIYAFFKSARLSGTATQIAAAKRCAELLFELSLFAAGATAQAQFSYIGSAMHSSTPLVERMPADAHPRIIFWLINFGLALGQFTVTYCAYLRVVALRKTKLK